MTYDTGLLVFIGSLAVGFGGWLIRMQSRVQTLEQKMINLHDDIAEVKGDARGTRATLVDISSKLAVVIDRLEDIRKRQ